MIELVNRIEPEIEKLIRIYNKTNDEHRRIIAARVNEIEETSEGVECVYHELARIVVNADHPEGTIVIEPALKSEKRARCPKPKLTMWQQNANALEQLYDFPTIFDPKIFLADEGKEGHERKELIGDWLQDNQDKIRSLSDQLNEARS